MMRYTFLYCFLPFFTLGGCDSQSRVEEVFTEADTKMELGRNVEILYSDSALVRVRIQAPTMRNFSEQEDPRQEFPDGVQVDFLDDRRQISSTLTARNGVRRVDKGAVTVRDSVMLRSAKKELLETEELIWEERTGRVHTDKFVKITKPGEIMYGYGLEARDDFSYWKILVPKGRIKTEQIDNALQE
jgi:LPS export ABC transporter protein LptC